MFNLDYEDICSNVPHFSWDSAYNFPLFLYYPKENIIFKFW